MVRPVYIHHAHIMGEQYDKPPTLESTKESAKNNRYTFVGYLAKSGTRNWGQLYRVTFRCANEQEAKQVAQKFHTTVSRQRRHLNLNRNWQYSPRTGTLSPASGRKLSRAINELSGDFSMTKGKKVLTAEQLINRFRL